MVTTTTRLLKQVIKKPGIDGAIMKKRAPKQPLVNSINVANIDKTSKEIEKAGGKIVVPKSPLPQMRWFCMFTDLDGNIHRLWQTDKNAKQLFKSLS